MPNGNTMIYIDLFLFLWVPLLFGLYFSIYSDPFLPTSPSFYPTAKADLFLSGI